MGLHYRGVNGLARRRRRRRLVRTSLRCCLFGTSGHAVVWLGRLSGRVFRFTLLLSVLFSLPLSTNGSSRRRRRRRRRSSSSSSSNNNRNTSSSPNGNGSRSNPDRFSACRFRRAHCAFLLLLSIGTGRAADAFLVNGHWTIFLVVIVVGNLLYIDSFLFSPSLGSQCHLFLLLSCSKWNRD